MNTIWNRRDFLRMALMGSFGAYALGAAPQRANAATLGNGTRVLFINLGGGLDGLFALQPSSGASFSALSQRRSTLCTAPEQLLAVGPTLGFHPSLTVFKSLFDAGEFAPILGVGYRNMSRSHLDSETVMAHGISDRLVNGSNSGFINRLGTQFGWTSLNAVSVTGNDLTFEGNDFLGAQVRGISNFSFRGFSTNERLHMVGSVYGFNADTVISADQQFMGEYVRSFQTSVNNTEALRLAVVNNAPAQAYPNTAIGRSLRDIDILFSSPELATRIGYIRTDGFDTHSEQRDRLESVLMQINAALEAFVASMKSKGLWDDLIIMMYSEFGRTTSENASGGTDHGGANSFFVSGGAVNQSSVFGEISASDLTGAGWLPMRFNMVELYRQIVARMGLDPNSVFGASDGASLAGLF